MPKEEFELDDPHELVGMNMPEDPEASHVMAMDIIDEYLKLGHSGEEIFQLFESPFYVITHGIFLERGPEQIRHWIDETVSLWRKGA